MLLCSLALGCPDSSFDFDGDRIPDDLDCDPDDATVFPGAPDDVGHGIDQDCDGVDGIDGDGDGHAGSVSGGLDCNDSDPTVYPGAVELPDDDVDQDCDGDDLVCDADGDLFTSDSEPCGGVDCDDSNNTIHPGVTDEVGDDVDSNCDGDDGQDGDRDGHRVDSQPGGDDCDDTDPDTWPGAPEVCDDDIDQDCDGGDLPSDGDGDGFVTEVCGGDDCDDGRAATHPGAPDGCNNNDDDCNGVIDDDNDLDGDGFCLGDCDDTDPDRFPGNWAEVDGDGVDSSCDDDDGLLITSGALIIEGEAAGDMFGSAVAGGGDLDGDGVPDLLVGAARFGDDDRGRAYVFLGSDLDPLSPPTVESAWLVIDGELEDDLAGLSVAWAGDLDGDGLEDLIVGAGGVDDNGPGAGKLGIFLGSTVSGGGAFTMADADGTILGSVNPATVFPDRVVAPGDIDGDGVSDILAIPSQWGFSGTGRVFVFSGAEALGPDPQTLGDALASVSGDYADDCFAFTPLGDLDGDWLVDFAVGCGQDAGLDDDDGVGYALVFLGSTVLAGGGLSVDQAHAVIQGTAPLGYLGSELGAGDWDGDGLQDLVVGSQSGGGGLFSGSTLSAGGSLDLSDAVFLLDPPVVTPTFLGELDGEPGGEIAVTADAGGSQLWIYSPGLTPPSTVAPADAIAHFIGGIGEVAPLGDLDGDGLDELVNGSQGFDSNRGRVMIQFTPAP